MWRIAERTAAIGNNTRRRLRPRSSTKRALRGYLIHQEEEILLLGTTTRRLKGSSSSDSTASFSTNASAAVNNRSCDYFSDPWRRAGITTGSTTTTSTSNFYSTGQPSIGAEDLAQLFQTLKACSTGMPQQLIAVNGNDDGDYEDSLFSAATTTTTTWRDAAILQDYRDGNNNGHDNNNSNTSMGTARSYAWGHGNFGASAALLEPEEESDSDVTEDHDDNDDQSDEYVPYDKASSTAAAAAAAAAVESHHAMGEEETEIVQPQSTTRTKAMEVGQASYHDNNNNTQQQQQQHDLLLKEVEKKIEAAIKTRRPEVAIQLFEEAISREHNLVLPITLAYALFNCLAFSHPVHTYQVMQYILQRTKNPLFDYIEPKPSSGSGAHIVHNNSIKDDNDIIITKEEEENTEEPAGAQTSNPRRASTTLSEEEITYLYRRMCYAVRLFDPVHHWHGHIRGVVGNVSSELKQLHPNIQKECYPVLVTSLVQQRSIAVGRWAWSYYGKMSCMDLDLHPHYFQHLLTQAKYGRMDHLPYHDVLYQTVQRGLRPPPHVVLKLVELMFPYVPNVKGAHVTLQAVMELQRQSLHIFNEQQEEAADIERQKMELSDEVGDVAQANRNVAQLKRLSRRLDTMQPPDSYALSIDTLEFMAGGAARQNHVELVLLIWDAVDLFGLEPSKDLYESTALCFMKNPNLCSSCFSVLSDMEEKGYKLSRAFVRGLSPALSSDHATLVLNAFHKGEMGDVPLTPALLNIVLSAHAFRGRVEPCLDVLDMFEAKGWSPDIDSFTSVIEAVGKSAKRLVESKSLESDPSKKKFLMEKHVATAEYILNQIEETRDSYERPIQLNKRLIRNYIEFLCLLGDKQTAGLVAKDFMERADGSELLVDNKTILRVAMAHAEVGEFDLARQFAASTSESLPSLDVKIDRVWQHFLRMNPPAEESSNKAPGSNDPGEEDR